MRRKRSFWEKLRNKYKLTIFNESTYEEVMHLRLSRLHVLMALSTLAVLLVTTTILLIAFTSLREFIPGYPDAEMRRQIMQNALQVDSLTREVEKQERFFRSFQAIISGEGGEEKESLPVQVKSGRVDYDSLLSGATPEELAFREVIEERERFNLSLDKASPSPEDFYHFFLPLDGLVLNHFDGTRRHYGVDIVTKQNTNVLSVLDGVVVFTDWTVTTEFVIIVQHSGGLLSIYKHNSVLMKKQGDVVRAGELLGIVGSAKGELAGPHLHFELWQAGKPLNPEEYIKFK